MASKALGLILNSALSSSSSNDSRQRRIVKATINFPRRVMTRISLPVLRTGDGPVEDLDLQKSTEKESLSPNINISTIKRNGLNNNDGPDSDPLVMAKLYTILEEVADRVEMHKNIGDQRTHWNSLLLTSINAITLTAATMSGIAAISGGAPPAATALKLASTSMYVAATGLLSIMNKIQPSQLAEEQRNAVRLFKQIQNQIQTLISIGNPTDFDVKEMMEKVLALDKAYPLPLLGVMLEKFPAHVEPEVWWTERKRKQPNGGKITNGTSYNNGWNSKLEEEMRELVKVMEIKDEEDYLSLGEKALKLSKFLAISAPVLTGLAAVGSALVGSSHSDHGGWAVMLGVMGGALASVANALEHGGQVGMVFEMYRSNAGFFELMKESIEWNLREEDLGRRENGEVFEMKVGLQLGRNLTQLRDVAAASSVKGKDIDEFASKLF